MRYDALIVRLSEAFGDRPFSVMEMAHQLGYLGARPPPRFGPPLVSYGGLLWSLPRQQYPPEWERGRQHAKADATRLWKMGLVARTRASRGRPGRRPYLYRLNGQARRYLAWLRGPGILDAFERLAQKGANCGTPPAGDVLVRRVRAVEGSNPRSRMSEALELSLSILRTQPSLQARIDALQTAAFASWLTVSRSDSLQDWLRMMTEVWPLVTGPYIIQPPPGQSGEPVVLWGWLFPPPRPPEPESIAFCVLDKAVVNGEGKPVLKSNGSPVTRDINLRLPLDFFANAFREGQTRFEFKVKVPEGWCHVALDLSGLAAQVKNQSPPGPKTREPRDPTAAPAAS